MKHYVLEMANKELKCRLGSQQIVDLEKKLGGKNVLKVLMDDEVPSLTMVLTVLHASLQQLEHGYTMQEVYNLYDNFIEDGGVYTDLIPKLIEILEVSGFFKKPEQGK